MYDLLACPFCGEVAKLDAIENKEVRSTLNPDKITDEDRKLGTKITPTGFTSYMYKTHNYRPHCCNAKCMLYNQQRLFFTKKDAVSAWNNRAGG